MSQGTGPGRNDDESGSEHADVLREVLDDQKKRQEAREQSSRGEPSDTSFFVQVGLLVCGTFFFYLLFFSPTWIALDPAPEISAQRSEESLRFYLFMMAKQVDAFQDEQGRLPETTDEIPGVKPGTRYQRISSQAYRISFTSGETSLTYDSSQDLNEFLGEAENAVLGTGVREAESPS